MLELPPSSIVVKPLYTASQILNMADRYCYVVKHSNVLHSDKTHHRFKSKKPKKIVREAMYGYNDHIDTFQRIIRPPMPYSQGS